MTTVDEIFVAITRLPRVSRGELMNRLTTLDPDTWDEGEVDADGNDAWDRQMAADARTGKFSDLIAEAKADRAAGLTRDLP